MCDVGSESHVNSSWCDLVHAVLHYSVAWRLQEAGGWATDKSASTSMQPMVMCAPNTGGSIADPAYDNPTYQILDSSNYSLSPALSLTILLQSWPINSYPFLAQLPQGSVLIIAGLLLHVSTACHGSWVSDMYRQCESPLASAYPLQGLTNSFRFLRTHML